MAAYQRGQTVVLTFTFTDDAGAPANPTTVTSEVEAPDGTETDHTASLVNTVTGTYTLIVPASQSGMWTYRAVGTTGTRVAVVEEQFHVVGSAF